MDPLSIAMRADLSERISSALSAANCMGTWRVNPWLFIWLFLWIARLDLEMVTSPFIIPISRGCIELTNWLFFLGLHGQHGVRGAGLLANWQGVGLPERFLLARAAAKVYGSFHCLIIVGKGESGD